MFKKRTSIRKKVLRLDYLHDSFLRMILEKFNPGHDSTLSLCFSSCRQEEGVSTIVFNMAMALAQNMSKRVLLIDGNTRRPKLGHWLGVPDGSPGLVDVLKKEISFEEAVTLDEQGTFAFLPVGLQIKHPIVLFDDLGFDQFLETDRAQYDIILFDAPALLTGPETTIIARKLDGFVMIVEAEKTRWEVAAYNKQQLADAGVVITGAILNKKKMFIPRLIYRLLLAD